MKPFSTISFLTSYFLAGYLDLPAVIREKTRGLLLANFGGLFLLLILSLNAVFEMNYMHLMANSLVSIGFVFSIFLIKRGVYLVASHASLIALLGFNVVEMINETLVLSSERLVYPMSNVALSLLLGFVFIGFISFKKWHLYLYIVFSVSLLLVHYINIVMTKQIDLIPQDIHFIIVDYLIVIVAGGLGVLLNLNVTTRLTSIEKKRTEQLNAYNTNLELLIYERTNDLKLKNTELEEKNKLLAEQQRRIVKASNVKEQFLSNVSHELRTPLNAVVGLTDLLVSTKINQENNLKTLKHSTNNLLRIVNDILDISKIENDEFDFIDEPFNLHEVLDSIHQVYRSNATIKKLDFNYVISPQLPIELIGDSVRLTQIITNLLSNAIKFTHEGGVRFEVTVVRKSDDRTTINFKIKDSGLGVAPEDQDRIFDKFTQLNDGKIPGTGLGLSIVKKMVESLGGEIHLKSELGKGSEFSLLLSFPIFKDIQSVENQKVDLIDVNLLIVEDNLVNQMVVSQLLSSQSPTIYTANNGLEATELCKSVHFDVILMDVQMPVMNGLEATTEIRKEGLNQETPIIALTANISEAAKEEAIASGMNDFLGKPFNGDVLFDKVRAFIKR